MASLLAPIPFLVFCVLEPISLVAGFLAPMLTPDYFISGQLDQKYPLGTDATSRLLAWQLGNCYLLLGLVGVFVLNTTRELSVVRAYIWALWLGDIGHVGLTLYALGWEKSLGFASWNPVTWGNIGITAVLFAVRTFFLAGFFG
ncbi:hypothetical protein EJ06DRAFT_457566, partial [Trichodelitschia bisporula]